MLPSVQTGDVEPRSEKQKVEVDGGNTLVRRRVRGDASDVPSFDLRGPIQCTIHGSTGRCSAFPSAPMSSM